MKNCLLSSIIVMALCGWSLSAEPLNGWLLAQIQKDEKLLSDAESQINGASLELLGDSRTYIPFFLESPENRDSDLTGYKPLFDAWGNDNGQSFLPGGYIFRLRFADAQPLYATSAGNWDGTTWHSLSLGKDFVIEPARVWNGSGGDYLFATLLAGVPPRIIVYDQHGEVKRAESFDVNDADFEQRVAAAEQAYAEKGSPVLEMLSLAEYVENPDAAWREADLSGQFNLRNQQQRDAERERLKLGLHLTRNTAIEALQSKSSPQEPQRPRASSVPMESSKFESPPVEEQASSTKWVMAVAVVTAAFGLLCLLFKKRK